MQTQGMGRMLLFISNNGQIMVEIVNNKNDEIDEDENDED